MSPIAGLLFHGKIQAADNIRTSPAHAARHTDCGGAGRGVDWPAHSFDWRPFGPLHAARLWNLHGPVVSGTLAAARDFLNAAIKRERKRQRNHERYPDRQLAEPRRIHRFRDVIVDKPPEEKQKHIAILCLSNNNNVEPHPVQAVQNSTSLRHCIFCTGEHVFGSSSLAQFI